MFAKMIPSSFRLNCDLQCVETDKQIKEIKRIQPTCFLFFLIVVEGGSGAMIMRLLFVERPVFIGPCQHVLKTFVWFDLLDIDTMDKMKTHYIYILFGKKKQHNLWTMAVCVMSYFLRMQPRGIPHPQTSNQPMLLVTSFFLIICNLKMDSWTRWPRKLHQ